MTIGIYKSGHFSKIFSKILNEETMEIEFPAHVLGPISSVHSRAGISNQLSEFEFLSMFFNFWLRI